jgi:two-component system, OmpR family, phosphate regulon sensor histidine kinase PhoR
VDVGWARRNYYEELLRQVVPIGAAAGSVSVSVLDEALNPVTTIGDIADGVVRERTFPQAFYDVSQATVFPPASGSNEWRLRVIAAPSGQNRLDRAGGTLMLMAAAAGGLLVALLATVRVARNNAQVTALKSEFVSTVTHELKTPIAGIQLVADSLAAGRYAAPETVREYGTLLSLETRRLTHLLENLLAYARLSDVSQAYVFERLDPGELVDDALGRCDLRLSELGFLVDHVGSHDMPRVRADRSAMVQVLENLIDNALNYSGTARTLSVSTRNDGDMVEIMVRDRGPGIPSDELPNVFDKFFRGRHARTGGSGLGLTIAHRIVSDHRGTMHIESPADGGTAVRLRLPVDQP